jgi:hypothetical protein
MSPLLIRPPPSFWSVQKNDSLLPGLGNEPTTDSTAPGLKHCNIIIFYMLYRLYVSDLSKIPPPQFCQVKNITFLILMLKYLILLRFKEDIFCDSGHESP